MTNNTNKVENLQFSADDFEFLNYYKELRGKYLKAIGISKQFLGYPIDEDEK